MAQENIIQQTLVEGEEKEKYLLLFDSYLGALTDTLSTSQTEAQIAFIQEFGKREDWDFRRIPTQEESFFRLAKLVDRVRQEYRWFSWDDKNENPLDNIGHFERLGISTVSGLPWVFDFVELERLRREADKVLEGVPSYSDCASNLRRILIEDYIELNEVGSRIGDEHRSAMKRNFLTNLKETEIIDWRVGTGLTYAEKLIPFGGEDLWTLSAIKFSAASSMFEVYSIDLWQDLIEPQIVETEGRADISPELKSMIYSFSDENAAWYVLRQIDERFSSLHPVHVSKALIGPFENRFLLKPKYAPLVNLGEFLRDNPHSGMLRFNRQYSYAPNHEVSGGITRQLVYRETWNDSVVICPGSYASTLSQSVLGTNLKVVGI